MVMSPCFCPKGGKFSRGADALPNAPSAAHGARSAAATELRRNRCCDGDAQTSSVARILRGASRRDALNEEPASFPPGDSNFNSWPTVLGHPPGPVIYINQTGDEAQKQDTQANKRTPLLREEVPYQITLIGLSQGSLDRRRREKVIRKMFTEDDC